MLGSKEPRGLRRLPAHSVGQYIVKQLVHQQLERWLRRQQLHDFLHDFLSLSSAIVLALPLGVLCQVGKSQLT